MITRKSLRQLGRRGANNMLLKLFALAIALALFLATHFDSRRQIAGGKARVQGSAKIGLGS